MNDERSTPDEPENRNEALEGAAEIAHGHLAFGWWNLLLFIALGAVLEGLHALKIGFYLDVSNETRRLMWTLAHAHGTLFGLVHIAFALSLAGLAGLTRAKLGLASRCLYAGTTAMPLGFFLGGLFVYEGDPGLPILLAPLGAVAIFVAVLLIALATRGPSRR